ncbi:MAG: M23 family metallopeptidase [Anaerolineaceae bacterium]|nr:M23 family metallopeptidase [Anaerolineaceae bacterium]
MIQKYRLRTYLKFLVTLSICAICASCQALPQENTAAEETNLANDNISANILLTSTPEAIPDFSTLVEEDPLVFTFPTPGMNPVSLWRPPLYQVPWALNPNDHFYFVRPIAADEVNWPLADYRYGGIFFGPDVVHTGIDIPNPKGTPVLAAGSGKVVFAGYGLFNGGNDINDPYGLAVTIQHDFGYKNRQLITVYAHMDSINVSYGQLVKAGDQLGTIGTTGFTTGPHLHFEVRLDTDSFFATRNPELWIVPPQGWGVLTCRFMNTNGSLLTKQTIFVKNLETNQEWDVITYGKHTVNQDEYYNENMVLSDLPAGTYTVYLKYLDKWKRTDLSIYPGAVTYCTFKGENGFSFDLPGQNNTVEIPIVPENIGTSVND